MRRQNKICLRCNAIIAIVNIDTVKGESQICGTLTNSVLNLLIILDVFTVHLMSTRHGSHLAKDSDPELN